MRRQCSAGLLRHTVPLATPSLVQTCWPHIADLAAGAQEVQVPEGICGLLRGVQVTVPYGHHGCPECILHSHGWVGTPGMPTLAQGPPGGGAEKRMNPRSVHTNPKHPAEMSLSLCAPPEALTVHADPGTALPWQGETGAEQPQSPRPPAGSHSGSSQPGQGGLCTGPHTHCCLQGLKWESSGVTLLPPVHTDDIRMKREIKRVIQRACTF